MTGHLGKKEVKEFKRLATLYPRYNAAWFSERFDISRQAADKRLKKLEAVRTAALSIDKNLENDELSEGLRKQLEGEGGELGGIIMENLRAVLRKKPPKGLKDKDLEIWEVKQERRWLRLHGQAVDTLSARSQLLRNLKMLFIDNRDQSTTINVTQVRLEVAREILGDPLVPVAVRDKLLLKYTEGVEVDG